MKRVTITLAIVVALIIPAKAQEKEEKLQELEKLEQKAEATVPPDTLILDQDTLTVADKEVIVTDEKTNSGDTSRIKIGDIVTVEDTGDETVIRIGHRGVRIKDDDAAEENAEEYSEEHHQMLSRERFRGHLGGIEFGFNNYSPKKWKTSVDPVNPYYELNTSKSSNFNLVLPCVSLGFTRHFGLVSSIGISWNHYRFDAGNSITIDGDGILQPYMPITDEVKKSKLITTYAVLPVMLEAQLPVSGNKTINIGAGVIGAIKLGSHTKVVYSNEGKYKEKDDFNLNLLRWGTTARVGYEMFQVYGTYYLSPMFKHEKGPELYPFEIGIALTFDN
jgi:hypothetical protein